MYELGMRREVEGAGEKCFPFSSLSSSPLFFSFFYACVLFDHFSVLML